MFYKVGHGHVYLPTPMPRTFRKQLTMRVRAATSASHHVSQTHSMDLKTLTPRPESHLTSIVRQFVSQIGQWWQPAENVVEDEQLDVDEMTQQLENELEKSAAELEVESVQDLAQAAQPNIWRFLQPASLEDLQKSRFMASISNASYYLTKITGQSLLFRYGMHLVTTSLKCKEPAKSAQLVDDALKSGDGMAVAQADIPDCVLPSDCTSTEMSNIVKAMDTSETSSMSEAASKSKPTGWKVPYTMSSMAAAIYSQSLPQLAKQITMAASVSHSAVSVTLTRVMSLLQAALRASPRNSVSTSGAGTGEGSQMGKERQEGTVPVELMNKCPTEWFVCDDAKEETRLFCIQGTDNFESWQTNISLDPVPFEDESLGVRVHRGIYEAALGLYGFFVPLIKDHVESGSHKKISFTGHSLGGAIATVLLMIMVQRGVLAPENVGQVFTFGSPACFCDACQCSSLCSTCSEHHLVDSKTLLERLKLPSNTVMNVVMHKDIVPRAFACDYALVAEFLRKWSTSFRNHHCLTVPGRSLLYNFIGEIMVLQPHTDCQYVNGEGYHPMLPPQAGLFRIKDPDQDTLAFKEKMEEESEGYNECLGNEVIDKGEAFLALMDNPHPLDILSEARAYGDSGTVSRYHNPGHYYIGIRSVLVQNNNQGVNI